MQRFKFLGGKRIAFVPLGSGNPYYYLSDHLGSAAVIASGDGKTIQWDADYFPFGAVRQVFTNIVGNNYEFTGYENDSETGYNYAVARFDSGRWGRFMSPDPYMGSMDITNPQSLNRYAYVLNDSTNMVDPLGLLGQCPQGSHAVNPPGKPGHCEDDPVLPADPCSIFGCDGGFGGAGGSVSGHNSAANTGCMRPSTVQRAVIPAVATAAKFWNKTLLLGLGGSGGAGLGKGFGIYGSASVQIAVSPSGSAAYVITVAAPASVTGAGTYAWLTPSTKGTGVLGGSQFGFSNATDPSQLGGLGVDASGSLAAGFGIGADVSASIGGTFPYTFNVTLGFGAGGRGSAGAKTNTFVVPICQN